MGAGNVKEVFVRWAHLDHAPFRLLAYMAIVAQDNGDPPMFYQGQESCALALGMSPDADAKARQAAFRGVRRHIETLIKAKCIERVRPASPGRNAEYALRLSMERRTLTDRQTPDGERPPSGGERRTLSAANGGRSAAQWRTLGDTLADAHRPPKEEQDYRTKEDDEVVTGVDPSPARGRARARETKSTRCRRCRADHTGLTCEQYRDGADLLEGIA